MEEQKCRGSFFWPGVFVLALVILIPGEIVTYINAFHAREPDRKFGREGLFQIGSTVIFLYTVTQIVAFGVTSPLYHFLRLPVSTLRTVIHSILAAALAFAVFASGLPMHIVSVLPKRWISNNGVPEVIIIVSLASLVPYLLAIWIHWILQRTVLPRVAQ